MKNILLLLVMLCVKLGMAQEVQPENLNALIHFCDSTKADEILIQHKGNFISHWKRTDFTQVQSEFANPE